MKSSKRLLSIFLVGLILLGYIPKVSLADNNPIILNTYSIETENTSNIVEKNERFKLHLNFKNVAQEEIKNTRIKVNTSTSNFSLVGQVDEKNLSFEYPTNEANTNFSFIYKGGSKKSLPITIYYTITKDGQDIEKTIKQDIDIYKARESKEELIPPNPEPEKPSKPDKDDEDSKEPTIVVTGNKTTLAKAGDRTRLSIKVKNTSETSAYNVSASISLEDDRGIFIDGSGYDDISRLGRGSDKTLDFRIEVDKFAEEKTYPIKVSFHYYNGNDDHFTNTDTVYLRVEGDGEDSQLIVDDVKFSSLDIKPGDIVWVDFELRNLSLIPVRDIKVSLDGLETDKFTLASGTNKFTLPFLRGKGFYSVRFPIKVSQKMKAGNHNLKLKINYKNLRGKDLEEEHDFFIPIKGGTSQNSSLIIEKIKLPSIIGPNQTATVTFDLRNRGQSIARDIIIRAELPETDGLVPKSVSTIKLDSLDLNESKTFSFSFYSTKKTPTKNYPINIKIEHIDDLLEGEEKYSLEQFLGVFVDNPDAEEGEDGKKSKPKLIIDKYSFSTEMVEAGKTFDMHLSFFNTNSQKAVKNIKIYLTAEDNVAEGENAPNTGSSVFTPVNSSNTFYIDSIPPKGRVQKTIKMFTIPDAAAKTHVITANFEYEDAEFDEYKATELIGVPVVQKSKLEVEELNYFPEASVGEPVSISAEFYNTGKATLYNMMVRLEGDFQTENGSYYIGNFAPGTNESFDGSVIPSETGILKGEVVFSFEDSTGEVQEIRRPFSLNVAEGFNPDEEFPIEEPKSLKDKLKWPIRIVIILVLIFAGFKGYKKWKKKKEDKELLDE